MKSGVKMPLAPMMRAAAVMIVAGLLLPAHAADLLEIYRLAEGNDPTFSAARHGFEAAREKSPQALAGNLPTVSLTGNENYSDTKAMFNGGAPVNRGIYAWTWTVQLTQPIMRPQNVAGYYEAQAQVEAADAEFDSARQDLILRVAQAYFDVLVAQEGVDAADAQLKAMEEQGKAARRGYELGTMSITDSYEAKSKAEQARAQLVAAQNDLDNKRSDLEKLHRPACP